MPLVEQELPTLPKHPNSPSDFLWDACCSIVCFLSGVFAFCLFSFGQCAVCPSWTYGFWLPLFIFKLFLSIRIVIVCFILLLFCLSSLYYDGVVLFWCYFVYSHCDVLFHAGVALHTDCDIMLHTSVVLSPYKLWLHVSMGLIFPLGVIIQGFELLFCLYVYLFYCFVSTWIVIVDLSVRCWIVIVDLSARCWIVTVDFICQLDAGL